jgi:cytochrome c553
MRKTIFVISILTSGIIALLLSCNGATEKTAAVTAISKDSLIKRGAYIVTIAGCDDCHSPKKMGPQGPELDMDRRLSGFPATRPMPLFDSNMVKKGIAMFNEDLTSAAGPWGVSFAANLTSDATGAGSWPEENFIRALKKGKFKGQENGRSLLPPMPWQNFAHMTDEDIKAVYAFLQSTKPVENVVPAARSFAELK